MRPPYRPSNGSEGEGFLAHWCEKCTKDNYPDEPFCEILGFTMAYEFDDPRYPKEWIYDDNDNPCCTAFEERK